MANFDRSIFDLRMTGARIQPASRQCERAVYTVSLSELPLIAKKESRLPDDLPSLFANLRQVLLQKLASSDDLDSTSLQYITSIKQKIDELNNLPESKDALDTIQETMEMYIRDLLSITQCPQILSNESFQEIFLCLLSVEDELDLTALFLCDPNYAQMMFNRGLEMLSLPVIQAFLNDRCSKELFTHLASIVYNIISRIQAEISFISFEKDDLEIHVTNLRLLIEYVDRNQQNMNEDYIAPIFSNTIIIVCNLANNTILVPTLLKANIAPYFVKWISSPDLSLTSKTYCFHALHNLARHDQGAKALNDAGCINILKDFKRQILDPNRTIEDEPYVELRLLYCMVFSLVTEPKEDQQDLTDLKKVLNRLMGLVVDAGQSNAKMSGGFDISEPLVVLTKLCLNDEILDYIVKECSIKTMQAKSIIDFFCGLLLKFRGSLITDNNLDQLTLIALFNMMWSISFHDEYIDELKSNLKFITTVKTLAIDEGTAKIERYVPRYMLSISKAANGILWNLDEDNPVRTTRIPTAVPTPISVEVDERKKDEKTNNRMRIMVSYSHADGDFCHQLVDALQKENRFDIWVDFAYCHTEDLWEEIGVAIEKADLILFLMSKDYQDSKSCRQEVIYAKDSLKRRFIPIYVKKDFVATGWLGVRIAGPQYIRFGKRSFDETIKELVKLIADDRKQQISEEPKPAPIPEEKPVVENNNMTKPKEEIQPIEIPLKPPNKPVEKWTKTDIAQWLAQHHVSQELIDIYDFQRGTDLLLYGQCLRPDWQIEYTDMRTRYEHKYHTPLYRDQFVRLVSAINTLRPSPIHSKTCIIT